MNEYYILLGSNNNNNDKKNNSSSSRSSRSSNSSCTKDVSIISRNVNFESYIILHYILSSLLEIVAVQGDKVRDLPVLLVHYEILLSNFFCHFFCHDHTQH